MMLDMKGRLPSLLAWGLLVGGVALLMTFPAGAPPEVLGLAQIPAAILFALAGFVFGLSHPEGRAWTAAALLGWVPLVAGLVVLANGNAPGWLELGALLVLPGVIALVGAWGGAMVARRRG